MNKFGLSLINGLEPNLGEGVIVSIVSILLVFLILGIIIAVTYFIGLAIQNAVKKAPVKAVAPAAATDEWGGLDIDDADAVAAVLVASIDYRNEIHQNVKVVSVKEIR